VEEFPMNPWLAAFLSVLACAGGMPASDKPGERLRPGEAINYADLAFYPERWKERKVATRLFPWEGRKVVLLTTTADLDGAAMTRFVERLDAGWQLYADLVGRPPRPLKLVNRKPCIAAVPDARLTCGYGCGYIGATGIEVAGFYDSDFPLVRMKPGAFPHYYFYEMGRNYYVFGDRHSLFVTGYAVFMRYVCMDDLKWEDPDAATRTVIEQCEGRYAASDLPFLKAFTTLGGLDEKAPRLKDGEGRPVSPSDQPVLYAAAMLKLRKDHGGDAWVRRFFASLARCPEVKADTADGALRQSLNWLVAASAAAGKDLSPVFADRWRLPLGGAIRRALWDVDWSHADLDPAEVIRKLPIEFAK
jgi:hypothetical protein